MRKNKLVPDRTTNLGRVKDHKYVPLRPESVSILGKKWGITYREMEEACGYCDFPTSIIDIQTGQTAMNEADTLLHEIIHATETALLLKLTERQVHLLATGLVGVFKESPEVLNYIYKIIHEQK